MSFLKLSRISRLSRCHFWYLGDWDHIKNKYFRVSKLFILLISKLRRISILLRCHFWDCQKLLDCQDVIFFMSRSRLSINTISRIKILGCQDYLSCRFWNGQNFLTVKMSFLKLSRISRLSKCQFWYLRGWDSQSRPYQESIL